MLKLVAIPETVDALDAIGWAGGRKHALPPHTKLWGRWQAGRAEAPSFPTFLTGIGEARHLTGWLDTWVM